MVSTVVAEHSLFSTCIVVLLVARFAARMVAARVMQHLAMVVAIAFDPEDFGIGKDAKCLGGGRGIL